MADKNDLYRHIDDPEKLVEEMNRLQKKKLMPAAKFIRLIRERNERLGIKDPPLNPEQEKKQKRENLLGCLIWLGIPAIIVLLKSCS